MPFVPPLTLWLAGASLAHGAAPCASPTSTTALLALVEEVQGAYGALDAAALATSADRLAASLECLREPVPRPVAAAVHRAVGLRAFADRDPEKATRAFAAARAIEPAYRFPDSLVPQGNPLWSTYEAIPVEAGKVTTVPSPPAGYHLFDGRPLSERPASWPVIYQQADAAGAVVATAYLWQDMPVPGVPAVASTPVASAPAAATPSPAPIPAEPTVDRGGPRWGLLGGGVGALVVAGALYGVAYASHEAYGDPATDPADKEGLRTRTNVLYVSSIGLAAVGVGCGVVSFLEVRW